MSRKPVLFLAVVALLAAAAYFWLRMGPEGDMTEATAPASAVSPDAAHGPVRLERLAGIPRPTRGKSRPADRAKPVLSVAAEPGDEEDPDDNRTPEERRLATRIEEALEAEDFDAAVACAAEALICRDAEIRQSMIDTLGWFGSRAIPELTPFLADPDAETREAALMEWTSAVADVESDEERIAIVEMAMQALTDEEALEDIANEYIGIDDVVAVESLLRVIESGCSDAGVAKAKETYEFVTGDEFESREEAERWIAEFKAETEVPDEPQE